MILLVHLCASRITKPRPILYPVYVSALHSLLLHHPCPFAQNPNRLSNPAPKNYAIIYPSTAQLVAYFDNAVIPTGHMRIIAKIPPNKKSRANGSSSHLFHSSHFPNQKFQAAFLRLLLLFSRKEE